MLHKSENAGYYNRLIMILNITISHQMSVGPNCQIMCFTDISECLMLVNTGYSDLNHQNVGMSFLTYQL